MSDLQPHLTSLFRYTRWADANILAALREASSGEREPEPLRRARALLSHALRAQAVWLSRAGGTDEAPPALWVTDSLDACARRSAALSAAWIALLEEAAPDALARPIRYQNSKGEPFEQALGEIAAHVVDHATHHRAQIAVLLREAGHEPPLLGFIYYLRATGGRAAPAG